MALYAFIHTIFLALTGGVLIENYEVNISDFNVGIGGKRIVTDQLLPYLSADGVF